MGIEMYYTIMTEDYNGDYNADYNNLSLLVLTSCKVALGISLGITTRATIANRNLSAMYVFMILFFSILFLVPLVFLMFPRVYVYCINL
jgi:hypothetical protein